MNDYLNCMLKLIFIIYIIQKFGLLFSIPLFILIKYIYAYIIYKLFNLSAMSTLDNLFITPSGNDKEKMNLIAYMKFSNGFNAEKIKQLFIEKAIKKVSKLRCKVTNFLGNYFWQELPLEEAIKRVKIINPSEQPITNDEEILKYMEKDINIFFKQLDEIPYEIKIIPYKCEGNNQEGAVVFKLDHCLSDGLGMLSLICFMADNYSEKVYPPIMRNFKIEWYHELLSYLSFIYYGPIILYNIFQRVSKSTPLRKNLDLINQDTSSINNSQSQSYAHVVNFGKTKIFDLTKFSAKRKELGLSFNELLMCSISKAFSRLCKESKESEHNKLSRFKLMFPIGRKPVPRKYEDILINNNANSVTIGLPVIESSFESNCESNSIGNNMNTSKHDISAYKKISNVLRNTLMKGGFVYGTILIGQIMLELIPRDIINYTSDNLIKGIDIVVSNLPGPCEELSFAGCKAEFLKPFATLRGTQGFLVVFSYNNKVSMQYSVDANCGEMNKRFLDILEKELEMFMG